MFLKRGLAGVALVLGLASPACAGSITLCNAGERPLSIAMIWNEGEELLFPRWQAQGWLRLAPQQCEQVLMTLLRQYLFLSPTEVFERSERRFLSRFELADPGPLRNAPTGSYGIERFFCIRAAPFQRQTVTLEEHETCPEGWEEQLFTLLVVNAGRGNLRLSLR